MPVSPSPGKGISTAGINKTSGWGSTDANGGVIPGHEGDQGINHIQGLSEYGLDVGSAVFVQTKAATGIAATTCTVNWQTTPAAPAGSIKYRLSGSSGAYVTVAEAAGTKSAHSIPLTGLVAGKTYEYTITQPSPVANGVVVEFSGRFHTTGGTELREDGLAKPAPEYESGGDGADGAVGAGTQAPTPPAPPTNDLSQMKAEESGTAPGLLISAVTIDPDSPTEVVALWRTDAYADGEVEYVDTTTNQTRTVREQGNKRMNHEVPLAGLTPGTLYLVKVRGTDAAGDTATSDVVEVRTPAS